MRSGEAKYHAGAYNYKYNGKELQDELGLNMYDYGARNYDPALGRWLSVDPLANFNPFMDDEHYINGDHNGGVFNHFNHNSYTYCYQNPILYVDPNGKQNIAGAVIGAVIGGAVELGGQLLSGKSIEQVDFADVGIEALKGGLIGSGAGVLLLPYLDAAASTAKAAVDISVDVEGRKDVFGLTGNKKSFSEFGYDAGTDFVGGMVGDVVAKKIIKKMDGVVVKMINAETKTVSELRKATNKFQQKTRGGTDLTSKAAQRAAKRLDNANSAAIFARKNTVRSQMSSAAAKSPVGKTINEGVQNTFIDKAKAFFGIR